MRLVPLTKVWKNKVKQYGEEWRFVKGDSFLLAGTDRQRELVWLVETVRPVHAGRYSYAKWGKPYVDFRLEELPDAQRRELRGLNPAGFIVDDKIDG